MASRPLDDEDGMADDRRDPSIRQHVNIGLQEAVGTDETRRA
jgi:hypothetical protein